MIKLVGGKKHITVRRVAAAGITVLAVLISVLDRIEANNLSVLAVLLGCVAGAIVGVQRALNGQINESTQQSFTTSLLNFIMGTTILVIFLGIGMLINRTEIAARISKRALLLFRADEFTKNVCRQTCAGR